MLEDEGGANVAAPILFLGGRKDAIGPTSDVKFGSHPSVDFPAFNEELARDWPNMYWAPYSFFNLPVDLALRGPDCNLQVDGAVGSSSSSWK